MATIRARVCDAAGPAGWRVASTLGTLPLTLVALVMPASALVRIVTMLVGVAWLVVGRIVVPRLRPRACEVHVESGAIHLRGAGLVSQTIHARDLRAASTAQRGERFALGLVRGGEGDRPLWLDFTTRADLDGVRSALRIRRSGMGTFAWPPHRGVVHTSASPVDVAGALGWTAIVGAALLHATEIALLLGLLVVPLTLIALVVGTVRPVPRGALTLGPTGVRTVVRDRVEMSPWSEIVDARVVGKAIAVQTVRGTTEVPLAGALPEEREHLAAQLRSGARRARGAGDLPEGVPPSVAVLAPRDEPTRAWLERLDATAATLARGEGYREVDVGQDDLWETLESPDAPASLRAAAARILARVDAPGAGPRIAQVVDMEHDETARQHIRVALEEDVDLAATELDRLRRA
jgi:hypothetical protein